MRTMDASLCELVKSKIVSVDVAMNYTNDRDSFARLVNFYERY